jgi:hypothetical protein
LQPAFVPETAPLTGLQVAINDLESKQCIKALDITDVA